MNRFAVSAAVTTFFGVIRSNVINPFRGLNFKGELFSSTFTFGLSAIIKLASGLILTRLLYPEAYGVVAILFSVAFVFELLSDVGTVGLLVRHARGSEPRFIHTLWTVRLIRSCLNFALMYAFAPVIAAMYEAPLLTDALRLFSYTFLLAGLQSMSFILAQRDQRSRILNYAEFIANTIMAVLVIWLATILKDHYAFIYGILVQRLLMTLASYFYYREIGVAVAFDRDAIVDQFSFARVVLPSSVLTILLTQYDKVVLLKLFDLSLLGIYGVAASIIAPIGGLIIKNSRVVLYARCAEYFRTDRTRARFRYYSENKKLLMLGTLIPAAIAGFAQPLVTLLYDSRYAGAGTPLMVLGLVGVISAFENPAENLLVAAGRTHVILMANVIRLFALPLATLSGYFLFGFYGFLWGMLVPPIAVMAYSLRSLKQLELLDSAAELKRAGEAIGLFLVCLLIGQLLIHFIPAELLQRLSHRH